MDPLRTRLLAAAALAVAAVVLTVLGYLGVSRELEVAFQLPYLASAGVGALLLGGAAAALVLGAQLQRDTDRLDELEDSVRLLATELARLADGLEDASVIDLKPRRAS